MTEENKALTVMEKDISDSVMAKISELSANTAFALPRDYNAINAIKSAMLIVRETKDKNSKPALEVCTATSVANSFLNMCIQGLDPTRRQCYFIVYGNQLQLFRSYFGTQAALRRLVPSVGKIVADLAREGDEYEWAVNEYGERYITRITTDPMKNAGKPYRFGFCNIFDKDGNLLGSTVMTWDQIKTAWAKTKTGGQTQKEFPEEMAKRTLINRACKHILNSSVEGDSVVAAAFNQTTDNDYEVVTPEAETAREVPKSRSLKEKYGIGAPNPDEPKTNTPSAENPAEKAGNAVAEKTTAAPADAEVDGNGPESFKDTPFDDHAEEPTDDGLFDGMEDVNF